MKKCISAIPWHHLPRWVFFYQSLGPFAKKLQAHGLKKKKKKILPEKINIIE